MTKLLGPIPPSNFIGDGCTGVSDSIHGVDVRLACRLHDWHYHLAKYPPHAKAPSRFKADWWLYRNTFRLLVDGGLWRPYAMLRALVRLLGVRWFGKWSGTLRWAVVALTFALLSAVLAWAIYLWGGP